MSGLFFPIPVGRIVSMFKSWCWTNSEVPFEETQGPTLQGCHHCLLPQALHCCTYFVVQQMHSMACMENGKGPVFPS